jgi:hypothetical protein
MTLEGTDGARELLLTDEALYVLADDMTAAEHSERRDWVDKTATARDYHYPLPWPRDEFSMYGTQRILGMDTGTGDQIWQREFEEPGEIMPATMAVDDGRVCLQTVSHVVCLDAAQGKELWRSERPCGNQPGFLVYAHSGHPRWGRAHRRPPRRG